MEVFASIGYLLVPIWIFGFLAFIAGWLEGRNAAQKAARQVKAVDPIVRLRERIREARKPLGRR
jgi:hypothetical protein